MRKIGEVGRRGFGQILLPSIVSTRKRRKRRRKFSPSILSLSASPATLTNSKRASILAWTARYLATRTGQMGSLAC